MTESEARAAAKSALTWGATIGDMEKAIATALESHTKYAKARGEERAYRKALAACEGCRGTDCTAAIVRLMEER